MKITERIKSALRIGEKSSEEEKKELIVSEEKLKDAWRDVLSHIKRDLAYIWSDDVKKDFSKIQDETKKLAFVLRKLHSLHGIDNVNYQNEAEDIKKLLYHLNRVEAKEQYVSLLQSEIVELVSDFEKDGKFIDIALMNERLKLLKEWEFPAEENEDLAIVLCKSWNNLLLIKNACGKDNLNYLFEFGFPACKNIILKFGLVELTKISKKTDDDNILSIFIFGLPLCQEIITKDNLLEIGLDLVKIANACDKEQIADFFKLGLTPCKEIILKYGLKDLVKIAQLCDKRYIILLFKEGLLICKERIIKDNGPLEVGLDLIEIANACDENNVKDLFTTDIRYCREIISIYGLKDLVKISKACTKKEVGLLLAYGIDKCEFIIKRFGLEDLVKIAQACKKEYVYELFRNGVSACEELIMKFGTKDFVTITKMYKSENVAILFKVILADSKHVIFNREDLFYMANRMLEHQNLFPSPKEELLIEYLGDIKELQTKEEVINYFIAHFSKFNNFITDPSYSRVDKLFLKGFLCVHVTNAYAGGTTGNSLVKQDPFKNLINDIKHEFNYNPSTSVIRKKKVNMVVNAENDIAGAIGVIYDYGNVYEAYDQDVNSVDKTSVDEKISFRTGKDKGIKPYSPGLILEVYSPKNSTSIYGAYNEFIINNWTVGAIFYTKGCQQKAIDKLIQISDEMSFKEYINGAYWYRETKNAVPKTIEKVFPVYEIDLEANDWKIVYTPSQIQKIAA